ncbi:hypothetical protein ACFXAF_28370 [Kitasatospora sp. NPDC059463]|uniref:hypothetical protein n=1 Tax=unclassified Kitasatospora TaxID=2633591 RepID=UPI0036941AD3
MRTDQVTVLITEAGLDVNAHVMGPLTPRTYDTYDPAKRYRGIIDPLESYGLECVVDYGASDYVVNVLLVDGSHLTISPPEDCGDYRPGSPPSWLVTRDHPDNPDLFEVAYDSERNGSHAANGGSVPELLAGVYGYLDRIDPGWQRAEATLLRAETLLRQAGFVKNLSTERTSYRLPATLAEPTQRRAAVARAVDGLRAEGYGVTCPTRHRGLQPAAGQPVVLGAPAGAVRREAALASTPSAVPVGEHRAAPTGPAPAVAVLPVSHRR